MNRYREDSRRPDLNQALRWAPAYWQRCNAPAGPFLVWLNGQRFRSDCCGAFARFMHACGERGWRDTLAGLHSFVEDEADRRSQVAVQSFGRGPHHKAPASLYISFRQFLMAGELEREEKRRA